MNRPSSFAFPIFAPPMPEHYSAFKGEVEDGRAVWFDPEVADDEAYRRAWAHAENKLGHKPWDLPIFR